MTDNIFEFAKTNQALGDLSETIIRLDVALKSKKQQVETQIQEQENRLQDKQKQIEALRDTSANILQNIDAIINNLDNILESNGTSNDHN